MIIKRVKRPWMPRTLSQGPRLNDNSFYQTQLWKRTRRAFIAGRTFLRNGKTGIEQWLLNTMCHNHFTTTGQLVPMYAVDHVKQIIEGGSMTDHANMQSLCKRCHDQKSAREANAAKKKVKP